MGSQDRKRLRARGRLEINRPQPLGAFRDHLPTSLPCAGVYKAPDRPGTPLLTPSTPARGVLGEQVAPFFPGDPKRGLAFPLGCPPLLGDPSWRQNSPHLHEGERRKVRNQCGGASCPRRSCPWGWEHRRGCNLIPPGGLWMKKTRSLPPSGMRAVAVMAPSLLLWVRVAQCPHPQATGVLLCPWTRGGSHRLTPFGHAPSQASHLLFLLHARDRPREVRPSARTSRQCL